MRRRANPMPECKMCSIAIPDGQGGICSMCYGDPGHGTDDLYRHMLLAQDKRAAADRHAHAQQWAEGEDGTGA